MTIALTFGEQHRLEPVERIGCFVRLPKPGAECIKMRVFLCLLVMLELALG